jgi:hypothetical protein
MKQRFSKYRYFTKLRHVSGYIMTLRLPCTFVIVLIVMHLSAAGQVRIQNLSLTVPDSNLLYIGVSNKIKVSSNKYKDLRLEANGYRYTPNKDGTFDVFATSTGSVTLKVYNRSKLLTSRLFERKRIPDAFIGISLHRDTVVTKDAILSNPRITIRFPGCILKHTLRIIRYSVSIESKIKSADSTFRVLGDFFPDDLLSRINQLESGATIRFENIRVNGIDHRSDSFYLTIK